MLAIVHACAVVGLDGYIVDVEVDFNPRAALPSFTIVGLPDTAVKESKERVRSAIKNSNRANARRSSRRRSLETDGLASRLGDQSPDAPEEHRFGLQFPNSIHYELPAAQRIP